MVAVADNPLYACRRRVHRLAMVGSGIAAALGLLALTWILTSLVVKGFAGLSTAIFTQT